MRAAKPTTRPPLSFQQFGSHSLDVLAPGFCFLRPEHPADPLIAGKRREVLPRRQNLWVGNQDASQIHRYGMDHSASDNPGTHRSPIVAPMRSKVALRSARRRALASSATSSATTPASERRWSSVPETSISPRRGGSDTRDARQLNREAGSAAAPRIRPVRAALDCRDVGPWRGRAASPRPS